MARRKSMPFLRVLARRKSSSLLRDHVHESRSSEITNSRKRVDKSVDVVTVDRTEVTKAELLEQHPGSEEGFHAFFPLPYQSANSRQRTRRSVDDRSNRGSHS